MGFSKARLRPRDIGILFAVLIGLTVIYFSGGQRLNRLINNFGKESTRDDNSFVPPVLPTSSVDFEPTVSPYPSLESLTPTFAPTSSLLSGRKIVYWNDFDTSDPVRGDWSYSPGVSIERSLLIIQSEDEEEWSGAYGNIRLSGGQGILIQFRYEERSAFHIALQTGKFKTDTFHSWGLGGNGIDFYSVITRGDETETKEIGDRLQEASNGWLILMLYLGYGKETDPFAASLWSYSESGLIFEISEELDTEWSEGIWSPIIAAGPKSKLDIARYEEFYERFGTLVVNSGE